MNDTATVSRRTEESPRFLGDTLIFYEGDVFDIAFTFRLDMDGEPVMIRPDDRIRFSFRRDGRLTDAWEEEIPGTDVSENVAVLHFTQELSGKFRRGNYTYRIQYVYASGAATVAAYGSIIVE